VIDPNDACPPDACPDVFTVTIHRDASVAFPLGTWELRVDSDLGPGDVACTIDAANGLGNCKADAATHALLDLGSVTKGTDVIALYLSIVGNPTRASITVLHDGAVVGTQSYSPTYTPLQNCGRTCHLAKDGMTIL